MAQNKTAFYNLTRSFCHRGTLDGLYKVLREYILIYLLVTILLMNLDLFIYYYYYELVDIIAVVVFLCYMSSPVVHGYSSP